MLDQLGANFHFASEAFTDQYPDYAGHPEVEQLAQATHDLAYELQHNVMILAYALIEVAGETHDPEALYVMLYNYIIQHRTVVKDELTRLGLTVLG